MRFLLLIFIILSSTLNIGCSVKSSKKSDFLMNVSQLDEEEEIYLQKKILINEMLFSSKTLHQISWPILKNNKDKCSKTNSYSFGILFASAEDLPKKDRKYFQPILNDNISPVYLKRYNTENLPVIVSVAKNSPAYKSNIIEGDIVLKINNLEVKGFRKKLRSAYSSSSLLTLTLLRNNRVLEKKINGIIACNYNIQPIPSAAPNAYADGEKVYITLAAIKLARTVDELAFLIGHELAHNIFHYKYFHGSEANTMTINYMDAPKIKNLNSFFLVSTQKKETEADLKGVEIAFKGGFALNNVNDYWRRLSVFNPSLISSSSANYKSNALRAILISKKLKELRNNAEE